MLAHKTVQQHHQACELKWRTTPLWGSLNWFVPNRRRKPHKLSSIIFISYVKWYPRLIIVSGRISLRYHCCMEEVLAACVVSAGQSCLGEGRDSVIYRACVQRRQHSMSFLSPRKIEPTNTQWDKWRVSSASDAPYFLHCL